MAAKTHVDTSVGERRLRPIYDWLDNGNNKKALQEADKVLKKQPNFQCAKVLKSLALLRLGKEEECVQLLDVVRAEVPADDPTLQAMTICYREIHRPERICDIYEAATRKDPANEELLTHLFMAYVRVADYKRQQQAALALYKLKPKNPYYFWAVMSVVMQAYTADDKLSKGVVLPLAERMVKKFVSEGKIEAEQEVQMYLMILEMQGKYEEALEVLDGPLSEKLVSYVSVPLKRAELLTRLGRWGETNVLYKSLLKENMDSWNHYLDYFTSALELLDSGQTGVEGADSSPEQCQVFLEELEGRNACQERRVRGPYLARLELYRRMAARGLEPQELLGDAVELMTHYFHQFGDKPCCVSDLRLYLPLVPVERRAQLLAQVCEAVGLQPGELPQSSRQMLQHISSVQLSRCAGHHDDLPLLEKLGLFRDLARRHGHGLRFCEENKLPTEFGCNDPYALLGAHVLYDAWVLTGASEHLVEAASLLERALLTSPSNFHVKLRLLQLYHVLGAGGAANAIYELLDVKHMQLDSLGYLHCCQLYAAGLITPASALYEATLKFFTGNYKDSVDHLTFSYKFGSFLKIEEFVKFRERLNSSLHYALVTVERMLLELLLSAGAAQSAHQVQAMEVRPGQDRTLWAGLRDNRDLDVLVSWDCGHRQMTSELVSQTFSADVELLRLRDLTLRGLGAAFDLAACRGQCNGAGEDPGEAERTLVSVSEQLLRLYERLSTHPPPRVSKAVTSAPPPSRLFGLLALPSCPLLLELLSLVRALAREDEASVPQAPAELLRGAVQEVGAAVKGLDSDPLANTRELLELAVNTTEMVGMCCLMCGVGQSLLKPLKVPLVKKGKKKKENNPAQNQSQHQLHRIEAFNRLLGELTESARELDRSLEQWESLPPCLLQQLSDLSVDSSRTTTRTRITESIHCSLRELRQLLQTKLRYLAAVTV